MNERKPWKQDPYYSAREAERDAFYLETNNRYEEALRKYRECVQFYGLAQGDGLDQDLNELAMSAIRKCQLISQRIGAAFDQTQLYILPRQCSNPKCFATQEQIQNSIYDQDLQLKFDPTRF